MKRILLVLALVASSSMFAIAQTTATNFTATDCNGNTHTLFNKLDSGKVVVLVWVMPCSMCVSDGDAAYDAAQSFATSHPGKVLYYLVDDYGNTSCSSLAAWATSSGIGATNRTIFGNAGMLIDENDYGGTGMPHVTVIGGASHTIFFNQRNGSNNGPAIQAAIQQALGTTGIQQPSNNGNEVSIYPNPASDKISVSYSLTRAGEVHLEVINVNGAVVKTLSQKQASGQQSATIDFDVALAPGNYTLKLHSEGTSKVASFTVVK
jgi:hypothetical protein